MDEKRTLGLVRGGETAIPVQKGPITRAEHVVNDQTVYPRLIDTRGVARLCGVSIRTATKWRDARRLPGAVKCGRVWRFDVSAIVKRIATGALLLPRDGKR